MKTVWKTRSVLTSSVPLSRPYGDPVVVRAPETWGIETFLQFRRVPPAALSGTGVV